MQAVVFVMPVSSERVFLCLLLTAEWGGYYDSPPIRVVGRYLRARESA